MRRAWIALLFLAIPPATAADRIVSLNLCTDQMLVLLAPGRIAALSVLAGDPALSFVATEAAHFPMVRASAEAVLELQPDLVLGARYGAQSTLAMLERHGIPVVRADLPEDFPGIRRFTRTFAALLGVPQRGAALIAAMDATLASVPPSGRTVTAIAWEPRGYTAGPGTLMDSVLRASGLVNMSDGQHYGVEALLRRAPGLLVVPDAPAFPSLATAMLNAPALREIPHRPLPPALTLCPGPFTAQAVTLLTK